MKLGYWGYPVTSKIARIQCLLILSTPSESLVPMFYGNSKGSEYEREKQDQRRTQGPQMDLSPGGPP